MRERKYPKVMKNGAIKKDKEIGWKETVALDHYHHYRLAGTGFEDKDGLLR